MDSSAHAQQMQVLAELEGDLHDALVVAQARHEETLTRMDSSRRLIETLLQNEVAETQRYIEDTTLEMRAITDAVRLEMVNTRREVDRLLREATANITRVRAARAATHSELTRKRRELATKRRLKKDAVDEERAESEWLTEAEERWLKTREMDAAAGKDHSIGKIRPKGDAASKHKTSVWGWPLIACIIVACLWVLLVGWRARRENRKRQRRILYSARLRSHFSHESSEHSSENEEASTPSHTSDPTHAPTPDTVLATARQLRRRSMLGRHAKPGWSPAASTASTASSPDDSSELAVAESP